MLISLRTQKVLIWWSIALIAVWSLGLIFLLHMLPPPSAQWSSDQIAQFYLEHATEVKWGAVLASWTSGSMIPLTAVIAVQIRRHEAGKAPVWTILSCVGGSLMTIWLAFPPLFFGAAAFTPRRLPDVTAVVHELGVMSLVTTDQFYIFLWVAVGVICLTPNSVPHSPFPRWFGYCSLWVGLMIETGAVAFLFRSGPLAWNGLIAWWLPVVVFFIWIALMTVLLFRAINAQMAEEVASPPDVVSSKLAKR